MANISKFSSNLPNKKFWVIAAFVSSIMFYLACNDTGTNDKEILTQSTPLISFSSTIPTDISNPADSQEAAEFAWKEFIAVTWPAKKNPSPAQGNSDYFRGQPSETDSSGSTGSGGVTVWETFYHRDELYPGYRTPTGNVLPNPDTIPNYLYPGFVHIKPATPTTNLHTFNNLDEASEINIAFMYYTPLAEKADALRKTLGTQPTGAQKKLVNDAAVKAGILYEAKGNPVIFNYLKSTGFNNMGLRGPAMQQNKNLLTMNQQPTGPLFTLPNGSIEIKATWRHFDASVDNLKEFHWAVGLYYTRDPVLTAHNDTLLLISLHIIQKTPNVPTFTFATFEHVSNEKNGFRFVNVNPKIDDTSGVPRPLPDSGIIAAKRQYPIPDYLVKYNNLVHQQLITQFGPDVVWANYQLIGVQAVVQDDPGGVVPDQQFFLSNFATETNNTLQFFQGGLAPDPYDNVPGPNTAHVFVLDPASKKYVGHTSGGCLGCHGSQGQFKGGDFSVISANGNGFSPEAVTAYMGGLVVPQNPSGFPIPKKK
jgi:hypothetical protein